MQATRTYRYYTVITSLFSSCLIISNIVNSKIFELGYFTFPAGIIIFPFIYVFSDIFTEVYGYAQSRKAIWIGFLSLLLLTATIEITKVLPPADFWKGQAQYEYVFGSVPRIVIASFIAYFGGEFVNSFVVAILKVKQKGKSMALRFVISTFLGQAVDTGLFIAVAFIGVIDPSNLFQAFLSGWLFKVLWEIAALPLTLHIVKFLKVVEKEDFFDNTTNFNPFNIQ